MGGKKLLTGKKSDFGEWPELLYFGARDHLFDWGEGCGKVCSNVSGKREVGYRKRCRFTRQKGGRKKIYQKSKNPLIFFGPAKKFGS